MDLKDRKKIKNGCLKKCLYGDDDAIMKINPYRLNDVGWDINQDYTNQTGTILQSIAPTRTVLNQSVSPQKENLNNTPAPITKDGITDLTGNWSSRLFKKVTNKPGTTLSNLGSLVTLAAWAGGGLMDGLKSKKSSDELLQEAGNSYNSFGGIQYRTQRAVNEKDTMDQYDKETLYSAFSNPLTAVGMLASRDDQREQIREANRRRLRTNAFERSSAASKYMQMKAAEEGYAYGKEPIETSSGRVLNKAPNAKLDYNEIIHNLDTGEEHTVKTGKGKVDGALGYVKDNDVVLSQRSGAADYYRNTGDLDGAIMINKTMRNLKNQENLPGLKEGWIPNAILHGLEGLTAIGDWLNIKNQPIKRSNTKTKNTYEGFGLRGLAGLNYSSIPMINALTARRAASDYALRNSGGLNGAQQYIGSIANTANMYKAIADLNADLQGKNIGLKSNLYNAALNVGAQNAQRDQNASQFDEEFYAKGHGARTKMASSRLADIFKIGQSWYTNDFKRRQHEDNLSLYQQKLDLDQKEVQHMIDTADYNKKKQTYTYYPQYANNVTASLYPSQNNQYSWASKFFPSLNFNMPYNKYWRIYS